MTRDELIDVAALDILARLEARGVVTTNAADAAECCGLPRDEDGFCTHRCGHPIYVPALNQQVSGVGDPS